MRFKGFLFFLFFLFSLIKFGFSAAPPAGTLIKNVAKVEYQIPNGLKFTALSNEVAVKVKQVFGVNLQVSNFLITALPGEEVNVPFSVTNTGNGYDGFEITASNLLEDDADLENLQVFIDENGNGKVDFGEPLYPDAPPQLAPGETLHLVLTGKVPVVPDGSQILINLEAQSLGNPQVTDNETVTVEVNTEIAVQTSLSADKTSILPGDTVNLTLSLLNKGNVPLPGATVPFDENGDAVPEPKTGVIAFVEVPDGFSFENFAQIVPVGAIPVYKGSGDSYWKTDPDAVVGDIKFVGIFIPDEGEGTLIPNQAAEFTVSLVADENAPAGVYEFVGTVVHGPQEEPKVVNTNLVTVEVKPVVFVDISDNPPVSVGTPTKVLFEHTVTLTGNTEGLLEIFVDKENLKNFPEGASTFLKWPDGTPITDTDGNGLPNLGSLKPGESKKVLLEVFLPEGNYEGIEIPLVVRDKKTGAQDKTVDVITSAKAVSTEIMVTVAAEARVVAQPLKDKPVYLYEYDGDGNLVKRYTLFTDSQGRIKFDENGNVINFYNFLKYGFSYRLTPAVPIDGFPYTLSPAFKKEYFDQLEPGMAVCWNSVGEKVSCDAPNVAIKLQQDENGNISATLKVDPAGYVYDGVTGERVNGAFTSTGVPTKLATTTTWFRRTSSTCIATA